MCRRHRCRGITPPEDRARVVTPSCSRPPVAADGTARASCPTWRPSPLHRRLQPSRLRPEVHPEIRECDGDDGRDHGEDDAERGSPGRPGWMRCQVIMRPATRIPTKITSTIRAHNSGRSNAMLTRATAARSRTKSALTAGRSSSSEILVECSWLARARCSAGDGSRAVLWRDMGPFRLGRARSLVEVVQVHDQRPSPLGTWSEWT